MAGSGAIKTASGSTVWSGEPATEFAGGDGSENNPYIISTGEELAFLANNINSGVAAELNLNTVYYKLANDIYLNNTAGWENWEKQNRDTTTIKKWTPIGQYTDDKSKAFKANFDGDGYAVFGIYINIDLRNQGIFGYVYGGKITNLGVEQSYIKGDNSTGGIAGEINGGTITNCYNIGNVSGDSEIGGIAGYVDNDSTITNCYNTGNISGTGNSTGAIAGVVYESKVANSYYLESTLQAVGVNIDSVTTAEFNASGVITSNSGITDITIGVSTTKLLDALNAWVDDNNTSGGYFGWVRQVFPALLQGTGADTDPYLISNKMDLILVQELIKATMPKTIPPTFITSLQTIFT